MVDTLGLLIKVIVHSADIQDYNGAIVLLDSILGYFKRLELICGDGSYGKGKFGEYIEKLTNMRLEIVKRLEGKTGFYVLPWRWIVERTLAWLGKFRRLSKDYEYLADTSESMIYAAMINIMVRRLAKLL